MAELLILWTVVAARRIYRSLWRRPAHARHRGALTVDDVLDRGYAETVHEIVEERRTGEIPRIDFVKWDAELAVAYGADLYPGEVAPIAAQLADQEPADYVELDGERVSYDDLCSFTFGWEKTADGGWKASRLAGASA